VCVYGKWENSREFGTFLLICWENKHNLGGYPVSGYPVCQSFGLMDIEMETTSLSDTPQDSLLLRILESFHQKKKKKLKSLSEVSKL